MEKKLRNKIAGLERLLEGAKKQLADSEKNNLPTSFESGYIQALEICLEDLYEILSDCEVNN